MQTNFLKMQAWLDYLSFIIELLIDKIMQDPIPGQNSRRAFSIKGSQAEKIEKMKRVKSSLKITPENPKPDMADVYTRLPRRAK